MTRKQFADAIEELVATVDSWNDAAADEDRGRANDALVLTLYDDGSGFLGVRRPGEGVDDTRVEDWHDFADLGELVKLMEDEGTEFDPD